MTLAPYAAREDRSRGRRHPEAPPQGRSEFQRDRDRIVHSSAFRRLEYKTQVFVSHEGDLYRNRLTHSLEVAQIVRSLARGLALNEDLSEAIALAHDLGHTPFGHAGQDALDDCMKPYGGFEHNAQSLRVVDELEDKYAEFTGLNLSFETREGILKHCSLSRATTLGDVGERFLRRQQPGLEAQLTNIADQIAYNNHDVDDGLRAGILSIEQLLDVPLFARFHGEVTARYTALTPRQLRHETIRRMINALVIDLHGETARRLASANLPDVDAVRAWPETLVSFSEGMERDNRELKRFLFEHLYKHHAVYRVMYKARRIVRELFEALFGDLRLLPPEFQAAALKAGDDAGRARVVADYVAGMTDRYAADEHARLYDLRQLR
ncbi:MAG: deoxyguanosinetriphosphate triphosphohydrolase [Nevskia sp.]|uniref:deoxyguanosinetriphosphate triphosphohydrolase n=1 Tax=Nevskia sp. TaxID=1929292 RepID=UPI004035845D